MKDLLIALLVVALLLAGCAPIQPMTAPATEATTETEATGTTTDLAAPLPTDPDVRIGTLENGLTYYIRHNTEPANRADLWLAVNAGSVLEDEDQRGLAHLLEHMLFNGTEHFPGAGVVDFLESIGMQFGADVNAHTSFDETVYNVETPTDDAATLDKAFQVLDDWAGHATLDPQAIDEERGVVVEEWRMRQQTSQGRITEQIIPLLLGGSHYAGRLPIGEMEVVENAPAETLRRYYTEWYRPDEMAVIAVGDFDVDAVEAMIREHFSDLAAPENETARPTFEVPAHDDTRYLVYSDPEESATRLTVMRKRPVEVIHTGADLQEDVIADLFYTMFNQRLAEITRQADAPFLEASSGQGALVRPVTVDVISARLDENKVLEGVQAIATEVERVRRHGFTDGELARAKQQILAFYTRLYNERENTQSASYASEYLNHFLEGEAIPSIGDTYALVQQLLDGITLEQVNEHVAGLTATDNRAIYITAPQKEGLALPTEDDLAAAVDEALAAEIDPYADTLTATELMPAAPEPAAIVSQSVLTDTGVTVLELANGVRVLLKPTDFKDDEILFNAVSLGGSSLVDDAQFPDASTIDDIVAASGVGELNKTDLTKLLAGKTVAVTPYIRELTEGMEGSVVPADLETMMQLIYLYFTAPRVDADAFAAFQNQQRTALANRAQNPDLVLQDTLTRALYGNTIRRGPLTVEAIDKLDPEQGLAIYQDRFADAGDFTFLFVGNFDPATMTDLAQRYLGNLPATGREESWRDVAPDLPDGLVKEDVYKGEGDRSVVQLAFTAPVSPTTEAELQLNAATGVLDIMLREELREKLGGVYSASAYGFVQELPDPATLAFVGFGAEPGRVAELVDATFAQIDDLRSNGPSAANLEKVIAQQLSANEEQLESNAFWLTNLRDYVIYGDADELIPLTGFAALVDGLTAEQVQAAAQEFLNPDRYIDVTLYPESAAPSTPVQ